MLLITPPKVPAEAAKVNPRVLQGNRDYTPRQTLASPVFWVMYVMFVLVASGGLTAVAQLASIAGDRYINTIPVTIFAITAPALTYALSLNNIMNGITRPLLGFVSDRIGREYTMFGAFLLEGIGIFALMQYGTTPGRLRPAVRAGVLRLGRDLQHLPGDDARPLRPEVRDDELRHAVHGEGNRIAPGSVGQCDHGGDGQLDCSARDRGDLQHHRGAHGRAVFFVPSGNAKSANSATAS